MKTREQANDTNDNEIHEKREQENYELAAAAQAGRAMACPCRRSPTQSPRDLGGLRPRPRHGGLAPAH